MIDLVCFKYTLSVSVVCCDMIVFSFAFVNLCLDLTEF